MESKQTTIDWLIEQWPILESQLPLWLIEQAKEMEHQQQVDLLKFSKEMCTPEAPIDYIIKEFNKYGK